MAQRDRRGKRAQAKAANPATHFSSAVEKGLKLRTVDERGSAVYQVSVFASLYEQDS